MVKKQFSHALRGAAVLALAIAALPLSAQSAAQGADQGSTPAASSDQSDDALFRQPETVAPAATSSKEAEGQSSFLKYDQVKVGGTFTGSLGFTSVYSDAWGGGSGSLAKLFNPTQDYLSPQADGYVTITAKPTTDFGVNMEFRTSWPYYTTDSVLENATNPLTGKVGTTSTSITIPDIDVWALYAKFNWNDKVYFSAGKQPISWGVSKGAFQPADDIFASSASIDLTDTSAQREGPLALKTTIPLGVTNNLYFYAGLPTSSGSTNSALALTATGSTSTVDVDPADTRLAVKGEYGFGNTELALAGYYSYNDHPRALFMGTTSLGSWNIYGEAILKYGSQRYFLSDNSGVLTGAQQSDQLYFTGTFGGYYTDADSGITLMAQYLYNGEGQTAVSAKDALTYYLENSSEYDSIKLGTHYGFVSISDSNLWSSTLGKDKLGASLIVISNLSDFSGYIMPNVSWTFFDYMILKIGAILNFGQSGDEYITYGVGQSLTSDLPTTAGAALTASLTIGTGSF
jgi:hypothetical protein